MNYEELINLVESYQTIIIHRHKRPDFDAYGSALGLRGMLRKNYPQKEVYVVGDDEYGEFSFIGCSDYVTTDKYDDALVIIVDTANVPRIEDNRYKRAKFVVKIDHHPDIEQYGNLRFVDKNSASTSEMIFKLFLQFKEQNKEFEIDGEIARQLFIGIYGDTGGFSFPNTSSDTFKTISELVKYEFAFEETVLELKTIDDTILRILGWAYQNIIIEDGVGHLIFDKQFQTEMNISNSQLSILVNHMGAFKSIKAWVIFNEYDKFIRINLRSKGKIDVSKIAAEYEGGGHFNASGGMIYDWTDVTNVIEKLKIATRG